MWKFQPPSSSQNSLHLKCRLFWFWLWPPPPYGLFPQFVTFHVWQAPLKLWMAKYSLQTKRWFQLDSGFFHFLYGLEIMFGTVNNPLLDSSWNLFRLLHYEIKKRLAGERYISTDSTFLGFTDTQMNTRFAPWTQIFPQNPFFFANLEFEGQILSFLLLRM